MALQKSLLVFIMILTNGCQLASNLPPIRTAESVDLKKFAGDWYVIANIPTFLEKNAFNAVENYAEPVDGKIATTFTFNKGSFDGEFKAYYPTGFVRQGTDNAVWGMQFVWPIKAEYRIVYVDSDYEFTIVGRTKRDYVWLMARQPVIAEADYERLIEIINQEGYDLNELRRVPQQETR